MRYRHSQRSGVSSSPRAARYFTQSSVTTEDTVGFLSPLGERAAALAVAEAPQEAPRAPSTIATATTGVAEPMTSIAEAAPSDGTLVRATRGTTIRSAGGAAGATLFADLLSVVAGILGGLAGLSLVSNVPNNSVAHLGTNVQNDWIFAPTMLVVFGAYGLYRRCSRRVSHHGLDDFGYVFNAVAVSALATAGLGLLLHRVTSRPEIAIAQLVAIALASLVLVPVGRAALYFFLHDQPGLTSRVLIVGSGVVAEQVRQRCEADRNIKVVGVVDDDPMPGHSVLGRIHDAPELCRDLHIDHVLVTFSRSHPAGTIEQLRELHGKVRISVVPRYFELMSWRSQVDDIDGMPVIDVAPRLLGLWSRVTKRSLDIVVSSIGLVAVAPLLAIAGVATKISAPGPVLFSQTRIGRGGREFKMWKLRTMYVGAHSERQQLVEDHWANAGLFKLRRDPRVFPIGRFLRRTSLDELPQLWNVLRGEMSLVGPRPFIPEESSQFDEWVSNRFDVRPGLTGLWQVSGRSDLTHDDLERLDYLYVASWSIWWDLRILWATPAVVLRGRGAY